MIPVFASLLKSHAKPNALIVDPFGGTGKIFRLLDHLPDVRIEAIELEPEWASCDSRVQLGNALYPPWTSGSVDAVCTSPTYGNRMADHHDARDASRRNTYTHAIGRKLHADNSGAMQWGDAYRQFHRRVWSLAYDYLRDGGAFVLNIKDHVRKGERMLVTRWHVETLFEIGFLPVELRFVACPGNRHGENHDKRLPYEQVIKFVKTSTNGYVVQWIDENRFFAREVGLA